MNGIVSAVGGMAPSIAYGLDIKETDDPNVKLSEGGMESIVAVTGSGTYLVDIPPHPATRSELVPWSRVPETSERMLENSGGFSPFAI